MRENQRRFAPTSLSLNQLRIIGDWGGASRFVGSRWEEVGLAALRQQLGENTVTLVAFCEDLALQQRLGTLGLPNPDALVVETQDDALAVRSIDMKWALDVASYRQISGANLADLFAADPTLTELVNVLLPPELAGRPVHPADGYFVCPNTTLNQKFLESQQNQRQEYPLESQEVLIITVNAAEFFGPLPGWYTAQQLARVEGARTINRDIDTADRYYHLGAGVNGAVAMRGHSIFAEEDPPFAASEAERWEQISAEVRPTTTSNILARLDVEMRRRRELLQRLRALRRCPYTFRDFTEDLRRAGILAKEEDPGRDWSKRYGELSRECAAEIMAAGRVLVSRGQSDAEALAALEQRAGEFRARAEARARAVIAEHLQQISG